MLKGKIDIKVFSLMLVLLLVWLSAGEGEAKSAQTRKSTNESSKVLNRKENTPTPQQLPQESEKAKNAEILPLTSQVAKTYAIMINKEAFLIIIEKLKYKLYVFKDGKEIRNYDVAIGKNPGQKQRVGDKTTPIGEFQVDGIVDSRYWTHDFGDGKGEIEGAYGPWFISLATEGWSGIGIHGTHDPSSIGTMASEGCIRMNNDQVSELKEIIFVGAKVVVAE
jgi:lipoprotein-anchoring transpeptidase ErfK/SrfK